MKRPRGVCCSRAQNNQTAWRPNHHGRHASGDTMFIVLDTETTGLEIPDGHRVIQLCAAKYNDDGSPTGEKFHVLFNPLRDIEAGATAVHGWTLEKLASCAPNDASQCLELVRFIAPDISERPPVYVHNLRFDLPFLKSEFEHCGADPAQLDAANWRCSLKMARKIWPGMKNTLTAIVDRLGHDADFGAHDALNDCNALARCVPAIERLTLDQYAKAVSFGALAKRQPQAVAPTEVIDHASQLVQPFATRAANAVCFAQQYVCEDEQSEHAGHQAVGLIKSISADSEKSRKALVEPIGRIKREVDSMFREQISTPLKQARADIEKQLAAHAAKRLAAQRQLEQRARERLDMARQAKTAIEPEVIKQLVQASTPAQSVNAPAAIGNYKTRWVVKIIDPGKVPDLYWRPSLPMIEKAVADGARNIAGCEITEEVVVSNRRRKASK